MYRPRNNTQTWNRASTKFLRLLKGLPISSMLIYVAVTLCLIYSLFPLFYIFITSLKSYTALYRIPPRFFVFQKTLKNYEVLWSEEGYIYFVNSFIVASLATFISLFLGVLAGYVFARFKFIGKKLLFLLILLTRVFPPVTTVIPIYFIINYLGLMNSKQGLILLYASLQMGLVVWIMRGFFATIPDEVIESASIDGASEWTTFLRIALPLASPGLAASGILVWILYWNEFLMALILTSTNAATTMPVLISSFLVGETKAHWGTLSALSFLGILPALLVVGIAGKYLMKGLIAGAVKG